MRKHRKLVHGAIPTVMAAAVVTAATGQAWAAPAQPGTVKESEKPAAQPGTEKAEEAAPEPVTQEAAPEPVTQEAAPEPMYEETWAPAENVVVAEEPAFEPVRAQAEDQSVTPVRGQADEAEVVPVRESQESIAVEPDFQPVAFETDLDDSEEQAASEVDDAIRPEEEEDAEELPETDDNDDDEGTDTVNESEIGVAAEPAVAEQAPVYEEPVYEETVYDEPVYEQPVETTFSGGAELQGDASGVGVGVDTTANSTTVSGGVNALGQEGAGQVQTTAVDDQTVEIAVNDFEPVSIETTVTDQSASVSVNDSAPLAVDIPQVEVPAEVTTAVDQAANDATVAADQITAQAEEFAESIPDAGDMETQLPAGLTASAWYQAN